VTNVWHIQYIDKQVQMISKLPISTSDIPLVGPEQTLGECEFFFYDVYFLLADGGIARGTAAIKKFHGSIGRMLDGKRRQSRYYVFIGKPVSHLQRIYEVPAIPLHHIRENIFIARQTSCQILKCNYSNIRV